MAKETVIESRQVGDTTPIVFKIKENGVALAIPNGSFLWFTSVNRDTRVLKVNKATIDYIDDETEATYTPADAAVDTVGVYECQVFGTMPVAGGGTRRFVSDLMRWEICKNIAALDFS